jgi:hypothetical protein
MIWLVLWLAISVYVIASVVMLIGVAGRWAWGLLPDDPEVADRLARMAADRGIVRLSKVPGYRG